LGEPHFFSKVRFPQTPSCKNIGGEGRKLNSAAKTIVSRFMDQEAGSEKELGQAPETGTGPAGDEHADEAHPEYAINIYRDWCKSCGICAAFCPKQCLSLDAEGNPVVGKAERCTGCRWCELHCPDFAICVREVVPHESKSEEAD
jgi:2-oxoglutarate ferredoxin oxidoreductase subunit delta